MSCGSRLNRIYFTTAMGPIAGVADWPRHQASDIEHVTGTKETLIHLLHLLMFGGAGRRCSRVGSSKSTRLVIALMIVAFLAHEATALWDAADCGRP